MSANDYYNQQGGGYPQHPQPSYGPPQGHYNGPPPQQGGYYQQGPPQQGYGGPPPMQYQQQPPPEHKGNHGGGDSGVKGQRNCLLACLATICFCCAVEECCECW
ncbi:unnamed protein product [Clonostachys rhizophaga]|uniref:Cysteine-rich transmembrane domain-containing protein n=2 Tax=Clonostachys TaxID=110564 RepID=A0A9N9VCQ0_9HYPO|nr:unnamed protein product [Clonostachys rhizophaga]CAI6099950.1 unnamed protein product [Clonostachys chloroleuca]